MSEVYFFGRESLLPKFIVEKFEDNISLKQIDFKEININEEEDYVPLSILKSNSKNNISKQNIQNKKFFYKVACGPNFCFLIDENFDYWGFGESIHNQLGLNRSVRLQEKAVNISKISGRKFENLICGNKNVLAIEKETKKLFFWGEINNHEKCPKPMEYDFKSIIHSQLENSIIEKSISLPEIKNRTNSEKYNLSDNIQLMTSNSFYYREKLYFFSDNFHNPKVFPFFKKTIIQGISNSSLHSLAWDSEGKIYSWGDASNGKLGHPIDPITIQFKKNEPIPKKIEFFEDKTIIMASCTDNSSVALTNNGNIYVWGKGDYSKHFDVTEIPSLIDSITPRIFKFDQKTKIIKIVNGKSHYAAIDNSGSLYTWGDCSDFCLGHPENIDLKEGKKVKILNHKKILDVACGDRFTVVIAGNYGIKCPQINLEAFNQKNFAHLRQKTKKLKEFAKKKEELNLIMEKNKQNYTDDNTIQKMIDERKINSKMYNSSHALIPLKKDSTDYLKIEDSVFSKKKINQLKSSNSIRQNPIFDKSQKLLTDISIIQTKRRNDSTNSVDFKTSIIKTEPSAFETQNNDDISEARLEILEMIRRVDKHFKIKNIKTEEGLNTLAVQNIYDEVAEEMIMKESTDPNFIPLDSLTNQKYSNVIGNEEYDNKLLEGMAFFAGKAEDDPFSVLRGKMLVSQLNSILKSKNDELKYEFIEMVRTGKEDEHMKYLLADPKEKQNLRENLELEKKLRRKFINNKSSLDMSVLSQNINLNTIQQSKDIQKSLQNASFKETLVKIAELIRNTERRLGNSEEYYEKYKIKETKEKLEGHSSIYENSLLYIAKKIGKIMETSEKNNERHIKAKERKLKIENEKKIKIINDINKKSLIEKKKIAIKRLEINEYNNKLKNLMTIFNLFLIINLFSDIASQGIELKRKMFKYNMKARIIQNAFKKHLTLIKVKALSPGQLKAFKKMIWRHRETRKIKIRNYQNRFSALKIHLSFITISLKRKIKTRLFIFRNNVINLQRFFHWAYKLYLWQMTQLSQIWDYHLISSFKSENSEQFKNLKKSSEAQSLQTVSLDENSIKLDSSIMKDVSTIRRGSQVGKSLAQDDKFLSYKEFSSLLKDKKFSALKEKLNNKGLRTSFVKLIPSIMPHTIDIKSDIKLRNELEEHVKYANQNLINQDYSNSYSKNLDILLPYTLNREMFTFPPNLKFKIDYSFASSEKIQNKMALEELTIKFDVIRKHLRELWVKFVDSNKLYEKKIIQYVDANKYEIDMERAKLMLRTPVEELKELHRKEDLLEKFALKNKPLEIKRDHLPYSNLIHKIAGTMKNSPPKPMLKLKMEKETFKSLFNLYFNNFKKMYHKLSSELRINGIPKSTNQSISSPNSIKKENTENEKSEKSISLKKNITIMGESIIVEEKEIDENI